MVDDLCPPALIIKAENPAEAVSNVHLAIMTVW